MNHAVNDEALDTLFRAARTHNKWLDKPLTPQILMAIYDLMRMAPTATNSNPARIYFVVSKEAKERLKPHLSNSNQPKMLAAPCCAIIGYDVGFAEKIPQLFPHNPGAKDWFKDAVAAETSAFRNGSMQGGYFILAARALGLDCGPMSGFNNAGVDGEFFAGTTIKSNFICNIGYGDHAQLMPRNPRLSFDEACKIL